VWVLPVYQHTFASKANLLAFEHRVAMCELSFASVAGPAGRVKVMRVEEEVATVLGTADAPVRTAICSLSSAADPFAAHFPLHSLAFTPPFS